ncbi:hypothetical protein [Moorena sp. SIO1G6]
MGGGRTQPDTAATLRVVVYDFNTKSWTFVGKVRIFRYEQSIDKL